MAQRGMRTTGRLRAVGALLLTMAGASLAGCGPGGAGSKATDPTPPGPPDLPDPSSDAATFTVSYRSQVRVPANGVVMPEQAFIEQVSRLDPIEARRCPVTNSASFEAAANALGGITWTHPVAILKDAALPPLYKGRLPQPQAAAPATSGASDRSDAEAPTISRPDLVGYQANTAIFLSQRHGLLAVKTDGRAPVLSCALKLPGQPKFFFYQGNELVLLVNGLSSVRQSALLRFRVSATGFDFVDSVTLDLQSIMDARLFNSTLVVYTTLLAPIPTPPPPQETPTPPTGAGGDASSRGGAADASAPSPAYAANIGVAVTAIKWSEALAVAWHEEFLNDPATQPLAGRDPVAAAQTLTPGDVVQTIKTFKPFISASDRYVVVSRDVTRTVFTGTRTQTYSYCSKSHEGEPRTVRSCAPRYERRPNPDYRPPKTLSGDYDCNGKTLLACIQEAAPTVSQYIYVRVGETCTTHTYRDWICDERKTESVTYPVYGTQSSTQFVVYGYNAGDFVKLDEQIYEMADPGVGAGTSSLSVPSLTFSGKPLEVPGSIDSKNDLQFQHGHFYVLTNQGTQLHTLLLVGNSIAKLGTLSAPRQLTSGASYSGSHSTLFSAERMMVSRAYYDSARPMSIPNWSDVIMFNLAVPAFPQPVNQFVMPGSSEQLILATDGILGPGTVSFTHAGVPRNLQKLTLFDGGDASEIGNLLLGTEFNANFVQSWLGVSDDQRIRLDGGNQRLFLPYSGYNHAPQGTFNPQTHRLSITAVGNRRLTPETTFDVVEDIVRTVSTNSAPGTGRALAFGDSSVYALDQTADAWSLGVVDEFATPVAVYRIGDQDDLHVRIDQIGARCLISTFKGSLKAFKPEQVSNGPAIACPERSLPTAIGLTVVYSVSKTGWQIGADGRSITTLDAAAVEERLTHVSRGTYCALDPNVVNPTPVPYLDDVPSGISCFPLPMATTTTGLPNR